MDGASEPWLGMGSCSYRSAAAPPPPWHNGHSYRPKVWRAQGAYVQRLVSTEYDQHSDRVTAHPHHCLSAPAWNGLERCLCMYAPHAYLALWPACSKLTLNAKPQTPVVGSPPGPLVPRHCGTWRGKTSPRLGESIFPPAARVRARGLAHGHTPIRTYVTAHKT